MKRFFASLFILGLFTFSCTDKCDGVQPYFDITGLQAFNRASQPLNESALTYNPKDSIRFEDFYIAGLFDHVTYATQPKKNGFSLIPAAFATECVGPGEAGSKEVISAIEVTALGNYSAAFPANSNISDLVKIDDKRIADYINNVRNNGIRSREMPLTFISKPENLNVKQAFRIKLVFENGETYMAETQPVKLF